MRYAAAILVGRAVRIAARLRKRGGGSAVPGLVVNRIAPGFLDSVLRSFPRGVVVVSGSSGKSTTTKMLAALLEAHGMRVFTNPSTANIAQGLTSALLERVGLDGRIRADIAVLEMDEGHGARIAPRIRPRVAVLTNVMTDQIDRFSDSAVVARLLATIAGTASEAVVANADDALLEDVVAELTPDVRVERFGVTQAVLDDAPRGLGYSATRAERATGGVLVSSVDGREAVVETPVGAAEVVLPARGIHYAVDAAAALAAAHVVLGDRFDLSSAARAIGSLEPVFGRGELVSVRGRRVEFVLVQNPGSYQLNVDQLPADLDQVLVAMGSDVRDPSYFWPVDPSRLRSVTVATGSKAHEFALHLEYSGVRVGSIDPDLGRALDGFLALPNPASGLKTIVFTADSMRRTRAHLGLA